MGIAVNSLRRLFSRHITRKPRPKPCPIADSPRHQPEPTRRLDLEELEPRVLLSGDYAGNLPHLGRQVQIDFNPVILKDAVGPDDEADYYQFSLDQASDIRFKLGNFRTNLKLELMDAGLNRVNFSNENGTRNESIIDLLPAGDYFAGVLFDGNRATSYKLKLSAVPNAGDSLETARDLGVLNDRQIVLDSVGDNDRLDYYRFSLDAPMQFDLSLRRLKANVNVSLLDNLGDPINRSDNGGRRAEKIREELGAGDYYIRVNHESGRDTGYKMQLNTRLVAGHQPEAAGDLGDLERKLKVRGFITAEERFDYYQFNVIERGYLAINLGGLKANVDLALLDDLSDVIERSDRGGAASEMVGEVVDPGNYGVRISHESGRDTKYKLSLKLKPIAANNLATARDLGTVEAETLVFDSAGPDERLDYFQFNNSVNATFRLDLSGQTSNVDLQLLDALGDVVAKSKRGGSADEMIVTDLEAGDYFARVQHRSGHETAYELRFNAMPIAGNSFATARDLGVLDGMSSIHDRVGRDNRSDFFLFSFDQRVDLSLSLDGLISDADLTLYDGNMNVIDRSDNGGARDEMIWGMFDPGNFYARVYFDGGKETPYDLNFVVKPDAGDTPGDARDLGELDTSPTVGSRDMRHE